MFSVKTRLTLAAACTLGDAGSKLLHIRFHGEDEKIMFLTFESSAHSVQRMRCANRVHEGIDLAARLLSYLLAETGIARGTILIVFPVHPELSGYQGANGPAWHRCEL